VELAVAGQTTLALYTRPTAGGAKGTVILLHDLGGHADWPGVIAGLRRSLPRQGWATLSVQLPLPASGTAATRPEAFLDQASARIDAALAFLRAENETNIVALGHGLGAVAALDYAAAHGEAFRGLVLVGLPHFRDGAPRLATADNLSRVTLPVLDLFGANERLEVVDTAALRREAPGRRDDYLQLMVPGADHFFHGQEAILAARVRGWLERHKTTTPSDKPESTQ
jgi:pimeloyl-ACP methyl ester carboxylesterase